MNDDFKQSLINKTLDGKYKIIAIVGIGGMAVVYKARDILLDRFVAVKVLLPEFYNNKTFRERFIREAKTSAKLSHPNIIPIHSVGRSDDIIYFVMNYIEGKTLKDYLNERQVLSLDEALPIIKSVVEALNYAHSYNVIHRDIKPGNIIITKENRIMVMDFGIAKIQDSNKLTKTGVTIGTPEYMSPEQIRGDEIDYRGDYYSLGVVIYEMLTGKLPFQAKDEYSLGIKHLTEIPVPPLQINPKIPEYINRAILKLLEKKKENRFRSAAEIFSAFKIKYDNLNREKKTHVIKGEKIKIKRKRYTKIIIILTLFVFLIYFAFIYFEKILIQKVFYKTGGFVLNTIVNSMREYIFPVIKPVELNVNLEPLIAQREILFIAFINKNRRLIVFQGDKQLRKIYLLHIYNKIIKLENPDKILIKNFNFHKKTIVTFSKLVEFNALNSTYKSGYISAGIYLDEVIK